MSQTADRPPTFKCNGLADVLLHMKLTLPLTAALIVGAGGCRLLEMAQSAMVVSALVVATPELSYPGYLEVEPHVVASAWIGQRPSATSVEPTPVSGLDVSVTFQGRTLALAEHEEEAGLYLLESDDEPALDYHAGETYAFETTVQTEPSPGQPATSSRHGGEAVAPTRLRPEAVEVSPAMERHPLAPALNLHQRGTAMTISWAPEYGRLSYVSVLRGDPDNPETPVLTFDTRPETASEMLEMAVGDAPTSVEIPASAFEDDGIYAVVLVALDKGLPSDTTFLGSPILAGSGTAVLVAVGDVHP